MSGVRWVVKEEKPFDDTRVFSVVPASLRAPVISETEVWVHRDKIARCARCTGPLVAMRTTCPHAQAVKRFLKKEKKEGKK